MKWLDHFLQDWRIRKALRYLPAEASVLDVGTGNGRLFQLAGRKIRSGTGLDPGWKREDSPVWTEIHRLQFLHDRFPSDLLQGQTFDAITLLAVLEHIPEPQLEDVACGCRELLSDPGRVILTVPSPHVDQMLRLLKRFRLIEGMSLEEHHGFRADRTIPLFERHGFACWRHQRFQMGLNHLFVFVKKTREHQ